MNFLSSLLFFLCFLNIAGCATTNAVLSVKPENASGGIYYRVKKADTLWKISKIYNVSLDEIVGINRLSASTNIEPGQLLFIPLPERTSSLPDKSGSEDFIWPVKGEIAAFFGQSFNNTINKGINIQVRRDADIVAARSGRVVFYHPDFKGFGRAIVLDHGDGFLTIYAGSLKVLIKIGENIKQGTTIARAGGVGENNAYLHFEVRKGHIPQNPYFYLPH